MAKNRGLGKGLDALMKLNIHEEENEETVDSDDNIIAGFVNIPINKIKTNSNQPRKEFDKESLEQLAQSIKNFGIIQPITVAKVDDYFEIIAGERRFKAAQIAELDDIPVIIKDLSQRERFEVSIVENIQRENLNPIEEALAYSTLIDTYSITQENLAERLGKSRTSITNTMRLLNLDPQIQRWLSENKLTPGHARAILSVADPEHRLSFAEYIINKNLSVREAEKQAKNWPNALKNKKNNKNAAVRELELQNAENKLEQKLQTKVSIQGSSHKGKIVIDYFTMEELERLIEFFEVDLN